MAEGSLMWGGGGQSINIYCAHEFLGHAPLIGVQSSHVAVCVQLEVQLLPTTKNECKRVQRSFLEPAQDRY